MTKKIILLLLLMTNLSVWAQKKMPSVTLHYSFTDFKTAMNIKASNFGKVIKNGQWSNFPMMDAGYGLSYWQGLHKNIDINVGINYTKSIYTFPTGTYTATQKLFTFEANGIFKILAENKAAVTPYISAGVGLYSNAGKTGFYAPLGLGVHANLWDEAFVFSGAQYRLSFTKSNNSALFYQVGVGTHLFRRKEKPLPPAPPPPVVEVVKPITKDVAIWVKDEATNLPLPDAAVTIQSANGKVFSGKSDEDGKLVLTNVSKDEYTVEGKLNGIISESKKIEPAMFDAAGYAINLILLNNDPRFTLSGKAVDKKGGNPVADVEVSVNNNTKVGLQNINTNADGLFKGQLDAASDFSVSGKKSGYFSNIEQVSTKGLNRSTTLYVKLELEIQEAKAGQKFVLNNIFFETNKATLNTVASTDLDRLVKYLQDNPSARVEIQGHTDSRGSVSLNNRLSKNRAVSVMNYLIEKGIAANRLVANGYGSSQPADTNSTPEGRANNRRVEVKILGE
ncbi:MAG: OmpA family protein [Sphingobacteriales bacterium]|nr:OmpA family protein [Sphingobacteriales bacterium]